MRAPPRIGIAALAGSAGKTVVGLGIAGALRRRGLQVAAFKKGPDFIDAAWLGRATGRPARNLDPFLCDVPTVQAIFARGCAGADLAVVEGNRGLLDGVDAEGTFSTARLAAVLQLPVILVLDATRVTRTLLASVVGCRILAPELDLAGVVLNRVGTARQEQLLREVFAGAGVPVLGVLPRRASLVPERHLGLVTPAEGDAIDGVDRVLSAAADLALRHLDLDAILAAAGRAAPLPLPEVPVVAAPAAGPRIGVLSDAAFSFYYPDNLEALEAAGARLVFTSPLADDHLPEVDALYAGGGFPEEHAPALAANATFRASLARRVAGGLPVWAECGGLTYLSQALVRDGVAWPMAGVLPFAVEHTPRPQGHGYVEARVDAPNPFLPVGTPVPGHEHHHGRLVPIDPGLPTVLALSRGTGLGLARDGLRVGSVVASWTHVLAPAVPAWAPGLVRAAASSLSSLEQGD